MSGSVDDTPVELRRRIVGVIITTSSVWSLRAALLRNSSPRIGMSPMPGIFDICEVTVLFMRPAMANVWPSCSSTSVSARRVEIAGTRNPWSVTAFAKSSELTSGRTFSLTRSVPTIVGVKFNLTPYSLNWIADAGRAALPLDDGVGVLAAGEEAGFLAVLRNQIGLGKALKQTLVLKCAERRRRFRSSNRTETG